MRNLMSVDVRRCGLLKGTKLSLYRQRTVMWGMHLNAVKSWQIFAKRK